MYKLVMYGLLVMLFYALVISFAGVLSIDPYSLILSAAMLIFSCYLINFLLSKIFNVPVNSESSIITGLILFFIMSAGSTLQELAVLALIGGIAMASKFLIAPLRRHIFNPAAFGAFIVYATGLAGAIWWVGSLAMLAPALILGFLITRKIRRFAMVFTFMAAGLISIMFFNYGSKSLLEMVREVFVSWPIIFFATVMLTEPITTPPTKGLQLIYAVLVGLLFGSQFQINLPAGLIIRPTPEFALLAGNIFSYFVSLKSRLIMVLREKNEIAKDVYEFIFEPDRKFSFQAGQYLEWTLAHEKADIRGVRRYFTIASSPTENEVKLGVKFNNPSSSFKKKLLSLEKGERAIAGQLGGDFVLPRNKNIKLAFLAGGIGITPFRSIIKDLSDREEKRDIRLLYGVKTDDEIAYRYLFIEAESKIDLKTDYAIGIVMDQKYIQSKIPDWKERKFYISGPEIMVRSLKSMLIKMGVSRKDVVTDYFPGFA